MAIYSVALVWLLRVMAVLLLLSALDIGLGRYLILPPGASALDVWLSRASEALPILAQGLLCLGLAEMLVLSRRLSAK
ncbi:MAG: hypothetical protein K2P58_09560 [Hyphomonadaceae bacterium]|nr:hypothetical protein [Hyphomonadaceae bacterium]